jgi:drug/metabolite transporter (DMT)-like permease
VTETSPASAAVRPAAIGILMLVLLWVVWGATWPAMRIVFLEVPVWQFRAVSCAAGAVVLLGLGMRLDGGAWRVPRRLWGWLIVAGLRNITGWHVLTGFGLQMLGAGHAAIVCYSMPVWVAIMSVVVLKEAMTARKIVGLILGVAAVVLLLSSDFGALGTSRLGILFVGASAISWAAGTIVVKRFDWGINMYALAGWQLFVGFFPMLAAALATERFEMHEASGPAIFSMIFIVLLGVVMGYALWFHLVKIFPPTVAAISSMMVPVVGVVSGAIVLGEAIGWRELAALGCVLVAVSLVVFQAQRPDRTNAQLS